MNYPLYQGRIAKRWNGDALPAAAAVSFELERRPQGLLIDFCAPFYQDPLPAEAAGSTPELWNYEVVEFFVASGELYTEIELGPGGHFLMLKLDGYRHCLSQGHQLRYKTYQAAGFWMGTALIALADLPPEPWTFNAYAIHGQASTRQYLTAFPGAAPAPDFHQLESFQPLRFA